MIPIDNKLRKLILDGGDELDFARYSFEECKLPSIHDDGAAKILAGKTTISEVRDVTNSMI